ncbi:DNA-protecting protein DprA [Corallococcus exiguus]|uniref:DNA-protecting protein DprA n=1 Tax=Corallococcus exiguus TaxID=83462 RepID=UPI001560850F|nr:DNA-protecting protein DprA [Corallococcus exiguus]NRD45966.1 DNA-protecting protein DprA [Corallococcus exiguus]
MNFDTTTESAVGQLTLLGLRGVGPATTQRLAKAYPTLRHIHEAPLTDLARHVPTQARATLNDPNALKDAFSRAIAALEKGSAKGVRILSYAEPEYPLFLKSIPDRPSVLYVKGTLAPDHRSIACIGTREPSTFGTEVSKRLAGFFASKGWSIVSGLALGVDALAHQAALDASGHTVAVLANGLDAVYPKKNAHLAEDILARGGAWVSEQPFGAPAVSRNLVQRDRLQSGMAVGIVVMQTDVIGGSMHTVRFCLMQGRRVWAPLPPAGIHAEEPKSQGLLALCRKTGRELATIFSAEPEYAALLDQNYATRPPATAITGKQDYDAILSQMEQASEDLSARALKSAD